MCSVTDVVAKQKAGALGPGSRWEDRLLFSAIV
jgi:hypothetical protein